MPHYNQVKMDYSLVFVMSQGYHTYSIRCYVQRDDFTSTNNRYFYIIQN